MIDETALANLEALEKAATPGPWEGQQLFGSNKLGRVKGPKRSRLPAMVGGGEAIPLEDSELIVATRKDPPGLLAAARERELFAAEKARVEVLYMDARREREQLLLRVRDAEAEAKRAGERESELCGLLEEVKAEREQLRGELERERTSKSKYVDELIKVMELQGPDTEVVELRARLAEMRVAMRRVIEHGGEMMRERDEARAALTSQQQATDEAMRRAEEARRELASIRSELLLP